MVHGPKPKGTNPKDPKGKTQNSLILGPGGRYHNSAGNKGI